MLRFCNMLAWLLFLPVLALPASAQVIDFDAVPAQFLFSQTLPGGPAGPLLSYPGVTFSGGVILDASGYAFEASSRPNLYATTDQFLLKDGSMLPALIAADFTTPGQFNSITLDIANGNLAGMFTVKALDAGESLVAEKTINLASYGELGAVQRVTLTGEAISFFIVFGDQPSGQQNFAIDTVVLSNVVPEPGFLALLTSAGLVSLSLIARRFSASKLASVLPGIRLCCLILVEPTRPSRN